MPSSPGSPRLLPGRVLNGVVFAIEAASLRGALFQLLLSVATAFSLAGTYTIVRLSPCNR